MMNNRRNRWDEFDKHDAEALLILLAVVLGLPAVLGICIVLGIQIFNIL